MNGNMVLGTKKREAPPSPKGRTRRNLAMQKTDDDPRMQDNSFLPDP